jgi:NMD protein affecting ribosome stability and mRNA decay
LRVGRNTQKSHACSKCSIASRIVEQLAGDLLRLVGIFRKAVLVEKRTNETARC